MSEHIITIELQHEHEDGSATYAFHMTKDLSELCGEYGLKLLIFCGVLGKSPDIIIKGLEREINIITGLKDEEDE